MLEIQRLASIFYGGESKAGTSNDHRDSDETLWWILEGRRRHKAWTSQPATLESQQFLPEKEFPSFGPIGISPIIYAIYHKRVDLQGIFDISTEHGVIGLVAWFLGHGAKEYDLLSFIPDEYILALDGTVASSRATDPNVEKGFARITWLMYLIWASSTDLQESFPFAAGSPGERYATWFFTSGAVDRGVANLIHPDWANCLLEEVPYIAAGSEAQLPRLALQAWTFRPDLQSAFDLKTTAGIEGLRAWSNAAIDIEPGLAWLKSSKLAFERTVESTEAPKQAANSQSGGDFGVNLVGYAFGELGIGEDVRTAIDACEAAGIPYKVVNLKPSEFSRNKDTRYQDQVSAGFRHEVLAPYRYTIFCLTAFETVKALLELGPDIVNNKYTIGWWPWELPVWPKEWSDALGMVDEIWSSSRFVQACYSAATGANANAPANSYMPLSVSDVGVSRSNNKRKSPRVRQFLYIFDASSYLERKNPLATIKAFKRAFPRDDRSTQLCIKTMNAQLRMPQVASILRHARSDSRIQFINETSSRKELVARIRECDVYISLHRSEGFGRTMAEALMAGRLVIATNFSGNVDFVKRDNSFPVKWRKRKVRTGDYAYVKTEDEAFWAEVSLSSAVKALRQASKLIGNQQVQGRIRRQARKRFGTISLGRRMLHRLLEVESTVSSFAQDLEQP